MKIEENVPISKLTTMRLGGNARYVITVENPEDVDVAYRFAQEKNLPAFVLGGGANTIGHDDGFPGVIILNKIKGIFLQQNGDFISVESLDRESLEDEILLTGMGGEVWDDFVDVACNLGYSGIETLSKIPGTVGAGPVQNIGAYGQDISQVISYVEAYDTKTAKIVAIEKSDMNMGYRHTRFNHGADVGRFVIISVTVKLHKGELKQPFYNSLQRYIDEHDETDFSPQNIRRMVSIIREEKLPDPEKIASAGSFFKNVYLDQTSADQAEAKGIPIWRNADGTGKINSGWLIESCGLKGKELFGFRISDKASLVLINERAKSYTDLEKARTEIVQAVYDKFGYKLEQEPVEIPADGEGEK